LRTDGLCNVSAGAIRVAPNWQRTLWLCAAMQATMATGFNLAYPFMPFFLAELGVSTTAQVALWSGAIGAISPFVLAFVSPFWGAYGDRHGRKPTVFRCVIVVAMCFGLTGLCQTPWQVLAVTAISGALGGFSATAMALVGTQAPEGRLGFALGWMATGQLIGSLSGPLLGGILSDHIHDYRLIFLCTGAVVMIAGVVIVSFVEERFERPAVPPRRPAFREQLGEIVRHPTLLPLLFVLLLAQLTTFAAIPIIPLYVHGLIGDVSWLRTGSGIAIAMAGVAGVIATPWLGRLGDRIGYRPVLLVSLACAALLTFPQAFIPNYWLFITLRFGAGLFLGGIVSSVNALIGGVFPREERGRIYGITSSAAYVGLGSGPAIGGLVAAGLGFSAVFVVVGFLLLVTLGLVAANTKARPAG
jgi:DHA1 family multidrug resistance protein-like MFS transporter